MVQSRLWLMIGRGIHGLQYVIVTNDTTSVSSLSPFPLTHGQGCGRGVIAGAAGRNERGKSRIDRQNLTVLSAYRGAEEPMGQQTGQTGQTGQGFYNTCPDSMVRERPGVLGSGLHLRTINTDLGLAFISCRGSYCSGNRERCMMVHKRVSSRGG